MVSISGVILAEMCFQLFLKLVADEYSLDEQSSRAQHLFLVGAGMLVLFIICGLPLLTLFFGKTPHPAMVVLGALVGLGGILVWLNQYSGFIRDLAGYVSMEESR
jgi:hypothetical protein